MKIEQLLKNSLRGNGVFSATTGLIALAFGERVAAYIGVQPALIVRLIGANLIVFALALFFIAGRPRVPAPVIQSIIVMDLLWVFGSGVLIRLGIFSVQGAVLLGLIAAVVLILAGLQYAGLRRSGATQATI